MELDWYMCTTCERMRKLEIRDDGSHVFPDKPCCEAPNQVRVPGSGVGVNAYVSAYATRQRSLGGDGWTYTAGEPIAAVPIKAFFFRSRHDERPVLTSFKGEDLRAAISVIERVHGPFSTWTRLGIEYRLMWMWPRDFPRRPGLD